MIIVQTVWRIFAHNQTDRNTQCTRLECIEDWVLVTMYWALSIIELWSASILLTIAPLKWFFPNTTVEDALFSIISIAHKQSLLLICALFNCNPRKMFRVLLLCVGFVAIFVNSWFYGEEVLCHFQHILRGLLTIMRLIQAYWLN